MHLTTYSASSKSLRVHRLTIMQVPDAFWASSISPFFLPRPFSTLEVSFQLQCRTHSCIAPEEDLVLLTMLSKNSTTIFRKIQKGRCHLPHYIRHLFFKEIRNLFKLWTTIPSDKRYSLTRLQWSHSMKTIRWEDYVSPTSILYENILFPIMTWNSPPS